MATLAALSLPSFVTSAAETAKEPEPKFSRTQHQVRIGGQVIRYTATVSWLIMKDDVGKPIARFLQDTDRQ